MYLYYRIRLPSIGPRRLAIMEFSSPCMPPPQRPFNGFGRDITNVPRARSFGKNTFNFRDMSMKRPSSDYFSLKSGVRGSSPTALAMDLGQNFHIDQRSVAHSLRKGNARRRNWANNCNSSPQLPTPRRSLFTSGIFAAKSDRGELRVTLSCACVLV